MASVLFCRGGARLDIARFARLGVALGDGFGLPLALVWALMANGTLISVLAALQPLVEPIVAPSAVCGTANQLCLSRLVVGDFLL